MDILKKPNFISSDERGIFAEVAQGDWKTLNYALRKKGSIIGNHYHKKFSELIFLISGKAKVKIININTNKKNEFIISARDYFSVNPFEAHALEILEDTEMVMLLSKKFNKNEPDLNPYQVL